MKKHSSLIIVILLIIIIGIILSCGIIISKKTVNLNELIEDVNSIRDEGKVVNAKQKEPYTVPATCYGKGYYIVDSLDYDYTDYFIYSNNKEIWHYTKTQEEYER